MQSPAARERAGAENFTLRANAVTREVIAVIEVEEGVGLELSIKLPASWPLTMAEVECRRQVLRPAEAAHAPRKQSGLRSLNIVLHKCLIGNICFLLGVV